MPVTDISEKGLEALIEARLLAQGYEKGNPTDYDREFCVDRVALLRFLEATQPETFARLASKPGWPDKFFKRLFDKIRDKGIIAVLRGGIAHEEEQVTLYYPRPSSEQNPDAVEHYRQNIFSVTRQLRYSREERALALDMAIFINGLPLITFELKNSLTKQNVRHAMQQYQHDRLPQDDHLFRFTRCLVHFAVDDSEVFMTTELRGENTIFLPFNRGHSGGAGNPSNEHGLRTAYLWEEVLQRDSLANIIEKFAQLIDENKFKKEKKKKLKLIFPRYHQLDLVRRLLWHAGEHGTGQRYLIQHSAGSGKSNSIAWLAHQLVELRKADDSSPIFESIVVVTDRRVLDRQIRETIKQFDYVDGVVEAVEHGSRQLRDALHEGKKIIITTIQKFPFIVEEMRSMGDRTFAIIIDEAHSSQSGQAAAKMNAALGADESEEDTLEDKINRIIEEQKMLENASYFAFTATPKNKTLETFGVKDPETGKFHPFHVYTMRQAIEEEFILDVLLNYTTYQTYVELEKAVEDDPMFDKRSAQRKLKRYVENHPNAIRQKSEIMIDHFLDEVIAKRKINGNAKAMVVTASIECAIRYYFAFRAYLKEIGSPYQAIVAFSGEKEVDGEKLDEAKMNGFPSADIPEEYKKPEYRFLIVAEKYQTGFDEPLLHTMYVDKALSDVKAVQTLSRLNRCLKPWKTDTFVLDFVNSADRIKESFDPFFQTTILSGESDLNRLNDLQEALDGVQLYTRDDVMRLMALYVDGAERDTLDPILDVIADRYKADLDDTGKIDFKTKAKSFVRMYQFLNMIRALRKPYWESLKTFLKLLLPKLPAPDDPDLAVGVLESIDMASYRAEQEATRAIKLETGPELEPTPADPRASKPEPELDLLSNILRSFNERYGHLAETIRNTVEEVSTAVQEDAELRNAMQQGDRQNARITFDRKVDDQMQDMLFKRTEIYRSYQDDPDFSRLLREAIYRVVSEHIGTMYGC